ncbi:MAG TPA: efflux RND transporter periplasmic adaptor subunit [Gemmatimonadaceae bacterium]|nr:efflux RND transporter periplasmic adaptor subunit [Gemmatimonadaceae bacterium]
MQRPLRVSLTIVAVVAAIGIATAAWSAMRTSRSTNAALPDSGYTTAAVRELEFAPRIISTGSIRLRPGARIAVGAQVSGVVKTLSVRQGSRVRAGELIAQLDDRDAHARLIEAEARIEETTSATEQATEELTRIEALARSGAMTQQELVAARATKRTAQARLNEATAARDVARLQLEYTQIRAPISGIVASIATHAGETVAASFTTPNFVTLIDPTNLECVALVDEADIGHVAAGDSADFTVDAYPGRRFVGVVEHIAPDATIVSGVVDYEVTIRILRDLDALKPQMTASVGIASGRRHALVVPARALRQSVDGAYVWQRDASGGVHRVAVRVGVRQPDVVEIVGRLRAGDNVLTSGFPDSR